MGPKIFISYNHNDSSIVDNILQKLESEFGQNNIFYDKWSIQPGDSIVGKMNEGLSYFSIFFFFVSTNSLQSKMVSLEWQTALNRATNKELKFVAVKIDDCAVPTIISNMKYLDLYDEGFDDTVEKMKRIIRSENTYQPVEEFQNLRAKITWITERQCIVTIKATLFAEWSPTFAFACLNNEFHLIFTGEFRTGTEKLTFDDGTILKAQIYTPIGKIVKPGFPCEVIAESSQKLANPRIFILRDEEKNLYEEIKTE